MAQADELVRAGLLLRVAPDLETARAMMRDCRAHLTAAAAIGELDRNGAYQLAYDAARKAITAHMRAAGLRVRSGPGAHEITGQYGVVALPSASVDRFDAIRRKRNRSEYGVVHISATEVATVLADAEAIVAAVERELL